MKIHWIEGFLRRANTLGYPMKGFWIQPGGKGSTFSVPDNLAEITYDGWSSGSNGEIYRCNTFLKETGCEISFLLDKDAANLGGYGYDRLYLYAIDMLRAREDLRAKIKEPSAVSTVPESLKYGEIMGNVDKGNNDHKYEDRFRYMHLAAILVPDSKMFNPMVRNIVDLKYRIKCDFDPISDGKQVEHYIDNEMGTDDYYRDGKGITVKDFWIGSKGSMLDREQEIESATSDRARGILGLNKSGKIE